MSSVPVRRIGRFPLSDGRMFGVSARILVERWAALLAPAALVGPVLLAALLLPVGLLASDRVYVVEHRFGLIGPPDPVLWWVLGCWLGLALVGTAYVVAAEIRLVRGALDERPVRVREAMRAAVGSVPAVLALLVLILIVAMAVIAAAVVTAVALGMWLWLTAVVFGLPAWWLVIRLLVAVPAVVVDGVGPLRGIRAAHRAIRRRGFPYLGPMLLLIVGATWGIEWLADWSLTPVEETAGLMSGALSSLPTLLLSPLWACLLTVVLLNPRPPKLTDLPRGGEPVREASDSPGPPALRQRALPLVLAALVVPGLLVTGLAAANPTGLPTGAEFTSQYRAPVDAHRLGDGRTASVVRRGQGFEISFCDRSSCPPGQTHDYDLRLATKYPVSSAALPDGTVAVAGWVKSTRRDRWDLRLFHCDRDGCPTAAEPAKAPLLREGVGGYPVTQDVAATGDGRIVVAAVERHVRPGASSPGDYETRMELMTCADARCENPRRRSLDAGFDVDVILPSESRWALTLAADDRPVLVGHDEQYRIVTVVCDSVECARPTVARTPHPGSRHFLDRFDATVDAAGRLVATYRAYEEGPYVLRCRDVSCRQSTIVAMPEGQLVTGVAAGADGDPVLALRRADALGRAGDDVVTLEACASADCADRRTLTALRAPLGAWLRDGGNTGPLLVREDPAHEERADDEDDGATDIPFEVTSIPADRLPLDRAMSAAQPDGDADLRLGRSGDGAELEGGEQVVSLEVGVVVQDLLEGHPGGE